MKNLKNIGIMKNVLLETSALLKCFLQEEIGHKNMQHLLERPQPALQFYITEITIGEVLNVLKNRLEEKEKGKALYSFVAWLRDFIIVLKHKQDYFNHIDTNRINQIVDKYKIEYTDAFHLLITKKNYHLQFYKGESKLKVICADKKMCRAWKNEGYDVVDPTEIDFSNFKKIFNIKK